MVDTCDILQKQHHSRRSSLTQHLCLGCSDPPVLSVNESTPMHMLVCGTATSGSIPQSHDTQPPNRQLLGFYRSIRLYCRQKNWQTQLPWGSKILKRAAPATHQVWREHRGFGIYCPVVDVCRTVLSCLRYYRTYGGIFWVTARVRLMSSLNIKI